MIKFIKREITYIYKIIPDIIVLSACLVAAVGFVECFPKPFLISPYITPLLAKYTSSIANPWLHSFILDLPATILAVVILKVLRNKFKIRIKSQEKSQKIFTQIL